VNALLSFVYTLLTHDVAAALETVGLDPAVGYLHAERPGRPSLALDLVEDLRPVVADRLVLTLINCQCRDKTPAILPVLPIRGEVNLGGDAVGTLQ
jgi:CRISPR-associated protein Cas1